MDNNSTNEIVMSFDGFNFLHRIIVEYSDVKIIWASENPMFFAEEFDGSYGESRGFDGTYTGLDQYDDTLLE